MQVYACSCKILISSTAFNLIFFPLYPCLSKEQLSLRSIVYKKNGRIILVMKLLTGKLLTLNTGKGNVLSHSF